MARRFVGAESEKKEGNHLGSCPKSHKGTEAPATYTGAFIDGLRLPLTSSKAHCGPPTDSVSARLDIMTIHNAGRVGNQHFFFPLGFFGWIFFFLFVSPLTRPPFSLSEFLRHCPTTTPQGISSPPWSNASRQAQLPNGVVNYRSHGCRRRRRHARVCAAPLAAKALLLQRGGREGPSRGGTCMGTLAPRRAVRKRQRNGRRSLERV